MEVYLRVADLSAFELVRKRLMVGDETLRAECKSRVREVGFVQENPKLSDAYLGYYLNAPMGTQGSSGPGASFGKFALSVLGFKDWSFRGNGAGCSTVALGEGDALDLLLDDPWFHSIISDEQRSVIKSLGGEFVFLRPGELAHLGRCLEKVKSDARLSSKGLGVVEAARSLVRRVGVDDGLGLVLDVHGDE